MRITCDHCGAVFYTETNVVCPACGSPYADDAEMKDAARYEQQKRDYDLESEKEKLEEQRRRNELFKEEIEERRSRNEQTQKTRAFANGMNKGCTFLLLAAGAVFVIGLILSFVFSLTGKNDASRDQPESESVEVTTETPMRKVEGAFGEALDAGQYTFKIDKIEKTDAYPWDATVGHTCVLIHALFTNNTDGYLDADLAANVVADGIAQHSFYLPSGYKDFSSYVPKGLTTEGWYKFEIPDDTETIEFRYGDWVVCRFTWDDVE